MIAAGEVEEDGLIPAAGREGDRLLADHRHEVADESLDLVLQSHRRQAPEERVDALVEGDDGGVDDVGEQAADELLLHHIGDEVLHGFREDEILFQQCLDPGRHRLVEQIQERNLADSQPLHHQAVHLNDQVGEYLPVDQRRLLRGDEAAHLLCVHDVADAACRQRLDQRLQRLGEGLPKLGGGDSLLPIQRRFGALRARPRRHLSPTSATAGTR